MAPQRRRARAGGGQRPLRVVSMLAPALRPLYELVTATVARRLERPAELVAADSYAPFLRREVDIGLVCGLPYVWLRDRDPGCYEPLAAPVLAGERYGGRPVYFSDVVVRADRPWRSLADLRGGSWGYNEPASHSGYGVVAWTLARRGLDWGHFGELRRVGYHSAALAMVADGALDAAAIDSHVLSLERRREPALSGALRSIERLGPSPIQPVVAARHLPDAAQEELRRALSDLRSHVPGAAVMRRFGVERFTPVGDEHYDGIRSMARTAGAAGLLSDSLVDVRG